VQGNDSVLINKALLASPARLRCLLAGRAFLDVCRKNHEKRNEEATSILPLPTRILEIHEDVIKLVAVGPSTELHAFVALSHCW
jgi:hypothetical protein